MNYIHLDLDERTIRYWIADGIAALEQLLAKHAAFDDYLSHT